MKAKKFTKLLPLVNVRSRRYYRFKGAKASQLLLLLRCVTELSSARTYDNISRTDVTFTSS